MVKEETYLMVSLEEEKSKQLAQAIANETSRKILDFISKNQEASASQLAKALNIPISTIDYNLKQLIKCGLIETKQFVWSEKGREMYLYRLAKKLVIISPSKTDILKELRNILPIVIISVAVAGIIQWFYKSSALISKAGSSESLPQRVIDLPVKEAAEIGVGTLQLTQNYAIWFLSGVFFALLSSLIWKLIKK